MFHLLSYPNYLVIATSSSAYSEDDMRTLFFRIPSTRISQTAVQFACQILEINQTRLLGLRETLL